jgi:hypothetical protein
MATPVELEQEIENINMRSLTRHQERLDAAAVSFETPAPMSETPVQTSVVSTSKTELPSPELRYLQSYSRTAWQCFPKTPKLQQKWVCDDGSHEWRDVPTVVEVPFP